MQKDEAQGALINNNMNIQSALCKYISLDQAEGLKITLKIGVELDIYCYSSTNESDGLLFTFKPKVDTLYFTIKYYKLTTLMKDDGAGVTFEKSMHVDF